MTTTKNSNTTKSNNHSLVGNALQLLGVGLGPYVTRMLREAAGRGQYVPDDADIYGDVEGDVAMMLKVMVSGWNDVFRDHLGSYERSLVSELRETRNRWAHMDTFNEDDLDRALDSIERLLTGVGARNEGDRVSRAKDRLRRTRYGSADAAATRTTGEREPAAQAPTSRPVSPESQYAAPEPAPAASQYVEREPAPAAPPYAEREPAPAAPQFAEREPMQAAPRYTASEPAPTPTPPAYGIDGGDQMDALIQRGVASRQQGDFQTAITSFGKAISLNREHVEAWYHRALTWGHMGEFERAINDFNRAISLDREFADAYNGRGYAFFCLGDDPKAIADFEQAMLIDPHDDLTRINLEKAQKRWAERNSGW